MLNRISAMDFLKAWERRAKKLRKGLKIEAAFWSVPVSNFPSGLPEEAKVNELTEDEVRAVLEESGESLDIGGFS